MAHYAYDRDTQSFWPLSLGSSSYEPKSIIQFEGFGSSTKSDVLLGCGDGYARQFDHAVYQDDGTAFTSYVVIGPVKLGDITNGLVDEMDAILANDSGDISWQLFAGQTMQAGQDTTAAAKASGTWVAGLNTTKRPRVRGVAFSLKLSNGESNDAWSFESVDTVTSAAGVKRA